MNTWKNLLLCEGWWNGKPIPWWFVPVVGEEIFIKEVVDCRCGRDAADAILDYVAEFGSIHKWPKEKGKVNSLVK